MPPLSQSPSLEIDARSKLQLTFRLLSHGVDRSEALSSARRVRSVRLRQTVVDIAIRIHELRCVEQVVCLRPQLEPHTFCNRKILEDSEIHRVISRAEELVALHIAGPRVVRASTAVRPLRRHAKRSRE